jgi:ribosome-associated protein
VEQWRDRLLANEDNALSDFFDNYPNADRQVLRNLMRAAQKEKEHNKPPANARKLFKYLRDAIH